LQQNGFEVEVNDEETRGQGSRLKLVAQPVSKSTVFDMKGLLRSMAVSSLITERGSRFGGVDPAHAGLPDWPDDSLFKSTSNVCHEGMQEEHHGWHAID
jgi:hypothetical protein